MATIISAWVREQIRIPLGRNRRQFMKYLSGKLPYFFSLYSTLCRKLGIVRQVQLDDGKRKRRKIFRLHAELVDLIYPASQNLAVGKISDDLLSEIKLAIDRGTLRKLGFCTLPEIRFEHKFLLTDVCYFTEKDFNLINESLVPFDLHLHDCQSPLLKRLHAEVREMFSTEIGSPFVIVNTRMWLSKLGGDRFGPNAFHTDGFDDGHLKVMIYVSPLNRVHGYFEYLDGGEIVKIIDRPAGAAVIFRNSEIIHSGVPGESGERISIEVTLMRSLKDGEQSWPGHFLGRHLAHPLLYSGTDSIPVRCDATNESLRRGDKSRNTPETSDELNLSFYFNRYSDGLKLNIGSGRRRWEDWICLDEVTHPGVSRITFSHSTSFSMCDQSVSLFYSSHCFEHLDEGTFLSVLREVKRSAIKGAPIIIKIPDYDYFINSYRRGITTAMDGKGAEGVTYTWIGKVEDNYLNRLSMMFAGYWNTSYGDHFNGKPGKASESYHGPARIPREELIRILDLSSPRLIARHLAEIISKDTGFSRFNHQNAWSIAEMTDTLSANGFNVISTSKDYISKRFRYEIPDLTEMQSWSAYFLATVR